MPRLAYAFLLAFTVIVACSSTRQELGRLGGEEAASAGASGAGGEADAGAEAEAGPVTIDMPPPNPDDSCGYQAVDARRDPARLFLVIDRSGSMSEYVGGRRKYDEVRGAVIDLVEQIGWRSEIGLAIYPPFSGADPCAAGDIVVAMQPGDPRSYLDDGKQGPFTKRIAQGTAVPPYGGTPTGKTLRKLVPTLTGTGKNTYVLLFTDGGPNCNPEARCEPKSCIPNIEGDSVCTDTFNCCDPAVHPMGSWENCLDGDETLSAVYALSAQGVKTIVVGIPGSEPYADLLDLMALAGGVPRDAKTRYYRVDDLAGLSALVTGLGSEVLVSCDIKLDKPPTNKVLINVFFDKKVIGFGGADGWDWVDEQTITLKGRACDDLLSGAVDKVQVYEGCPTQDNK